MPKFVLRINSVTVLSSFLSKKFEIVDMCPYLKAHLNLEEEWGGKMLLGFTTFSLPTIFKQ